MKAFHLIPLALIVLSCAGPAKIVQKPINFNAQREALSLQYLKDHYGLEQETPTIDPKIIVLHWTAIPTLAESFEEFYQPTLHSTRADIQSAGALNTSSQYMIDRDGTIYQLMPDSLMARHVIGLNHTAIGVENVGGTKETPLTRKQLRANIALVKKLAQKYPIAYVIGHYEYPRFEHTALWLEKDSSYRTQKTDPGPDFMKKVRRATRKLHFKPVPNP